MADAETIRNLIESAEKGELDAKIEFTDREVWAEISRTIKTSESKYEFSKFALGFKGRIADDVSREAASGQIFKELMTESVLREAAIRSAAKDPTVLDRIVILLRALLEKNEPKKLEENANG